MIETTNETVYIATDGKKFIDREECLEYERKLTAIDRVKYYKVKHDLIDTESGIYNKCVYFAIAEPEGKGCYFTGLDALDQYCLTNFTNKSDKSIFYTDPFTKSTIRRYTRPVTIMKDEFFSVNTYIHKRVYFSDSPIIQLDEANVPRINYDNLRKY